MFNPGLEIGQTLKNSEIVETFKCGNMGAACAGPKLQIRW